MNDAAAVHNTPQQVHYLFFFNLMTIQIFSVKPQVVNTDVAWLASKKYFNLKLSFISAICL